MKTAYKNVGLFTLVIATGLVSCAANAAESTQKKTEVETVKTETVSKGAGLKERAVTLWYNSIAKVKQAATCVTTQTKGVGRFIVTDAVGENMSWALYAQYIRNIGRNVGCMALSAIMTYTIVAKMLSALKSCMYNPSEEEMEQMLARRRRNSKDRCQSIQI